MSVKIGINGFGRIGRTVLRIAEQNDNDNSVMDGGLLGMLVPGNFRDMDFVFSDPNDGFSSGRQLFLEMIRMAYRWEALDISHKRVEGVTSFSPSVSAYFPALQRSSMAYRAFPASSSPSSAVNIVDSSGTVPCLKAYLTRASRMS